MAPFGRLFQLLNFEVIKVIWVLSEKGLQQTYEGYDIILVLANLTKVPGQLLDNFVLSSLNAAAVFSKTHKTS